MSGTFTTKAKIVAEVDTSTLKNGGPIVIANDQRVPVELTVSKTYDRFFDGIDFLNTTPEEIEASVLSSLELDTALTIGTYLAP